MAKNHQYYLESLDRPCHMTGRNILVRFLEIGDESRSPVSYDRAERFNYLHQITCLRAAQGLAIPSEIKNGNRRFPSLSLADRS